MFPSSQSRLGLVEILPIRVLSSSQSRLTSPRYRSLTRHTMHVTWWHPTPIQVVILFTRSDRVEHPVTLMKPYSASLSLLAHTHRCSMTDLTGGFCISGQWKCFILLCTDEPSSSYGTRLSKLMIFEHLAWVALSHTWYVFHKLLFATLRARKGSFESSWRHGPHRLATISAMTMYLLIQMVSESEFGWNFTIAREIALMCVLILFLLREVLRN